MRRDESLLAGAGKSAVVPAEMTTAEFTVVGTLPTSATLGSMSDNEVTLSQDDRVTHIEDVLATAPIEPGKLGHHTVLSVGGARVIVLAFARGQHMREHRSHHPLLLQALDGRVRVSAAEQTLDLRPGGLLYLPNALAHSIEALEPSRVSLTPIGI